VQATFAILVNSDTAALVTMNLQKTVKIIVINIVVVLLLLFLIEGMVSYFTIGHAFFTQKIAERQHTEYDQELGWINLPNVYIEDMYSREDYLTTNSQRYRNARDFEVQVPTGKIRIVCSGDSFTLGFGVDDDHTWCHQLTTLDKRLETVNMGQGGYGVDQAFLWYMRDQKELEHNIVLFAFIRDDFLRMESDTFMGYGRPYLSVREGELVQENFPVPRRSYDVSWLTVNLHMWQQLDTSKWLEDTFGKYLPQKGGRFVTRDHAHTDTVAEKIFAELQEVSQANQREFILVYLPTRGDIQVKRISRWERLVRSEADSSGYHFIDVADAMRTLPVHEVDKMFRKGGHYTDEGNRYVAEIIYQRFRQLTELSKLPGA
jgi:hypothetical protein